MRDIIILDCPEVQCYQVLMIVFVELCQAFKDLNYNVKIISNINDISNNCIVFMGDKFVSPDIVSLLNSIAPEAIYIGWYWHNIKTDALKYFIYTYENRQNPDGMNKFLMEQLQNCPLLLRASEHPDLVSSHTKNIIYDYCYMGWGYCRDLVPGDSFHGVYHGVYNHDHFLPYDKRREIYLSSIFALGFQSSTNIDFEHVSQRIFEGLAYGCIVLSNSLPACEQTNNIVVHVTSKQDLENKMRFFKANPDIIKRKQEEGYEFIKKYGTNHYAIDKFINCIKQNFAIVI
jgi:spore maturation protein CgeB